MLTSDLHGERVVEMTKKEKLRKIGKVRGFVFHPSEKRVVGIMVKRPDAAMMFHRKDVFVRWRCFTMDTEEHALVLSGEPGSFDRAAEKELGVKLDECVLWWGMPVMSEDGTSLGVVGDVEFDYASGEVQGFVLDEGKAAADALLGRRKVTRDQILGFRKGIGEALVTEDGEWDEEAALGAILVSDEVKDLKTMGGLAEKAGRQSAVTRQKVRVVVKRSKPKVDAATEVASEAAEKALFVTGRQLGRASTMFSDFKEEFDKARNSED